MKTKEFLNILEKYRHLSLKFEYAPNAFVGANYHITEVKHMVIESVDCGAQADAWNETVVQLWESPAEKDKITYMSGIKALGILRKVGSMRAYDLESEVKFEYSNSRFHTAQLHVKDILVTDHDILVKLGIEKTDCKAKELCGVPNKEQDEVLVTEGCCEPNSGCC